MPAGLFRAISIALLIVVATLCGLYGGPTNSGDVALIRSGIELRHSYPAMTLIGEVLNIVGGVAVTLGIALAGALRLWFRRHARRAVWFAAVLVGGRLLVEAIKLSVQRARPSFDPHPVAVHSLSFPSAHAANSLISFAAMALVLAPVERRWTVLPLALLASLAVGSSRTLLGVHFPSDVIAGWSIGAAWLLACWPVYLRLQRTASTN